MAALIGPGVEDFRARQVTPVDVTGADLVLVMTAEQRRALSAQVPVAVRRIFTLREFAELAELTRLAGHTPGGPVLPATVPQALASLVAAAPRLRSRRSGGDDVEDPYRRGGEVYVRSLAAIDAAVARIGRALRIPPSDDTT
jgi:protein-tyrosine phosphatase